MKSIIKIILKYLCLFLVGGLIYYGCECLWRGFSHVSMFILGGICMILLGLLNEVLSWDTPLWKQMLLGTVIILILEFITGYIVNIRLGWNVWDYSDLPSWMHIKGQVCLPFAFIWFFLSGIGIVLDDWLRYWFFGEEKPRYKLW